MVLQTSQLMLEKEALEEEKKGVINQQTILFLLLESFSLKKKGLK